jgi:hypothetical protein
LIIVGEVLAVIQAGKNHIATTTLVTMLNSEFKKTQRLADPLIWKGSCYVPPQISRSKNCLKLSRAHRLTRSTRPLASNPFLPGATYWPDF